MSDSHSLKPRRVDLSPDNFIAGIAGQMNATELGVYWIFCLLIYSKGGPIVYDETQIAALLPGTHWRTIRKASERLQGLGKISSESGHVMAKGCAGPIQDALKRISRAIQNGSKGGRPPSKFNGLNKPKGFVDKKLARASPSPSPPSSQSPPIETPSLHSGVPAQAQKRKTRAGIPEGFPLRVDRDWAERYWIQRGRADLCTLMDEEAEKFRDYHNAKLTSAADWPACWRTWTRNAIKYSNGAHNGKFAGRKPTAHDNFLAGGLQALERFGDKSG